MATPPTIANMVTNKHRKRFNRKKELACCADVFIFPVEEFFDQKICPFSFGLVITSLQIHN
jgi:hypothetical protein